MNRTLPSLFLLAACAFASCRSRPQVRYGDATGVETLTVDFGSTDLQTIAADLTESMLRQPLFDGASKPVLYLGNVENATSEHVDTKNVLDSIRVAILRSGRAQIAADTAGRGEVSGLLEYQRSGAVSPETVRAAGRQTGASHVVYGRLTSIDKASGREKDVFFKFTLNLVGVESGLYEWADEVQIRKTSSNRRVGW